MTPEKPELSAAAEGTTTTTTRPRNAYGRLDIAVAIVFGLLYAYVLWTAIGNLIQVQKELLPGLPIPWAVLVTDVAAPVVAYAVAFLLGRRRPTGSRAILFTMGLVVLACVTVGSIAYVQTH